MSALLFAALLVCSVALLATLDELHQRRRIAALRRAVAEEPL
jgi:hypothetical protein